MLGEILKSVDDKYKDRIKKEYEIIGEEVLTDLIKINKILENKYKSYSFSGTINTFYICNILNITHINPIALNIDYSNNFYYSISIPLNEKDALIKLLKKEIKGIKKVSKLPSKDNTYYDGIVIDKESILSTYKNGIVKQNKKDIIHQYQVINIYEKEVITLINKMIYGNEELCNFNNLKKINMKKTKDKTTYEIIAKDIKDIDLKQLVNTSPIFNINHLDHIILENNLTYFKYYQPRTYYINYLEYLSSKVDINIIYKYGDNFNKFFKEFRDELTYEYKFYSLWYDFKNELKCEITNDFDIKLIDNKIVLNYQNIIKKETTSKNKFNTLLDLIDNNKETLIFGYYGDTTYYLSGLFSCYSNVNILESEAIINPLSGIKIGFDYNPKYINETSIKKYNKFIKYLNKNKTILNTEKVNIYELLILVNSGVEIIIIDGIEELIDISNISVKKVFDILNKLNKRIFILERRKI